MRTWQDGLVSQRDDQSRHQRLICLFTHTPSFKVRQLAQSDSNFLIEGSGFRVFWSEEEGGKGGGGGNVREGRACCPGHYPCSNAAPSIRRPFEEVSKGKLVSVEVAMRAEGGKAGDGALSSFPSHDSHSLCLTHRGPGCLLSWNSKRT